jgi:hypothetical protein
MPHIPHIPRISVDSSSLAAIGYLQAQKILDVHFRNGSAYRYFDVPPAIYQALLMADSKGRFFNASIRNAFRSARLL